MISKQFLDSLVGLNVVEAKVEIVQKNLKPRVVSRGDDHYIFTAEVRFDRINLSLDEKGVVIKATAG